MSTCTYGYHDSASSDMRYCVNQAGPWKLPMRWSDVTDCTKFTKRFELKFCNKAHWSWGWGKKLQLSWARGDFGENLNLCRKPILLVFYSAKVKTGEEDFEFVGQIIVWNWIWTTSSKTPIYVENPASVENTSVAKFSSSTVDYRNLSLEVFTRMPCSNITWYFLPLVARQKELLSRVEIHGFELAACW